MMTKIAFVAGAALAAAASAQVSYNGGTYSENFDGLGAAVTGAFTNLTQAPIPGVASWQGGRVGGSGTSMNFVVSDGASNSGALFNFGATADSDRALGALASGTNIGGFGVEFINDGTDAIDTFTIEFGAQQYRSSTSEANILAFAWGVSSDGVLATDFLTSGLMTADSMGDVVGQAPVTTNGILSPAANLGTISVTVSGLNVAVGDSIFLRWQDFNNLGNDAGLAINNFSFSATSVPAPGAAALLGLGGLMIARRRR